MNLRRTLTVVGVGVFEQAGPNLLDMRNQAKPEQDQKTEQRVHKNQVLVMSRENVCVIGIYIGVVILLHFIILLLFFYCYYYKNVISVHWQYCNCWDSQGRKANGIELDTPDRKAIKRVTLPLTLYDCSNRRIFRPFLLKACATYSI